MIGEIVGISIFLITLGLLVYIIKKDRKVPTPVERDDTPTDGGPRKERDR